MGTPIDSLPEIASHTNGTGLVDSNGWDGKLRVDRKAVVTNAEILSDPEYSDEDAPPVELINADEGRSIFATYTCLLTRAGGRPVGRL